MRTAWSNIEAIARELCERRLQAAEADTRALAIAVDRCWHCVAAEIEAGLIDEQGDSKRPYDADRDLEAYRDWRYRHLTY